MKRLTAVAIALALSPASQGRAAPAADPSAQLLQELPQQKLASGQCALVLWTRTTPARRIFMALDHPAGARIQTGGKTVDLVRTGGEGALTFGHNPAEAFAGGGVEVKTRIELDARNGLAGGAVVRNGTVEYRDAAGWSVVLPVAGMLACQG